MNDDRLEKLLNEKKAQTLSFEKSVDEFTAAFFAKAETRSAKRPLGLRKAAIFAAAASLLIAVFITLKPAPAQAAAFGTSEATSGPIAATWPPAQKKTSSPNP